MNSKEPILPHPALDYVIPNAEEHQTLLKAMRKACGWDVANVPKWFVQQAEGTRVMCIFYVPGTNTAVGMGGVEMKDFDRQDKDVADLETKRGCVVSLFLYKNYRGKGYLGRMLEVLEDIARQKELETLTIYGLSKAGGYEKFGYKTFKIEPRNYGGENNWETRFLAKSL
ncbi:hypothetical protein BC939DRAFT_478781 [Gamsiella multidivaricata]|uniref:uncharacterized protein n=1 Tax=Gamsiella multidivaricata TaxID=101098 RepID=UPI00221F5D8A|nr:uncharacterized protein BC939DRAFT_478781 [Gamsiella multidivaricata]KAI7820668.1 hypothetical protein BC939DRAFT_478781 [Gamsiella multidivaricata]